jgi:erythromycin esterase-like protein
MIVKIVNVGTIHATQEAIAARNAMMKIMIAKYGGIC